MSQIRTATGSLAYAKYQLKRSILESSLEENFTDQDYQDALEFFDGCAFCGSKDTTRNDHLVPVVELGDFVRNNVVPACQECDDSKGQKKYRDWMINSDSKKSLKRRGLSPDFIEGRIKLIEQWQGDYTARSEEELFGEYYDQYQDILRKMESLCEEARQLIQKVNPKFKVQVTSSNGESIADQIRQYAIENYIEPARVKNEEYVIIRSGDVHSGLYLRGNHANVCQALRGEIFQELAKAKLVSESGPRMGGNTYFRYRV